MSFKKRHKSTDVDMEVDEPDDGAPAVVFALVNRLASVVLSSLPMQSLSASTLEQVRVSLVEFRSQVLYQAILKCLKALKKNKKRGGEDVWWPVEVSLLGMLRLLYAMNVSRNLSIPCEMDMKIHSKMIELLSEGNILPELIVEVVRPLLSTTPPKKKLTVLLLPLLSLQFSVPQSTL